MLEYNRGIDRNYHKFVLMGIKFPSKINVLIIVKVHRKMFADNVLYKKHNKVYETKEKGGVFMDDMERLLKQAFEEIVKEEYQERPKEIPEHKFSLKFRWKMYWVFRAVKKREENCKSNDSILDLYRPVASKHRLTVIALLLTLLIGGSAIAAEPMIQWLRNYYLRQYEDHINVQKKEESENYQEAEFQKYYLMELPEGYSVEYEEYNEEFQKNRILYNNKADDVLLLRQAWKEKDDLGNITSNREAMEPVEVEGFTGYYTLDKEQGMLILSDDIYIIVLSGCFSKETLIEFAGHLEFAEN